MNTLPQPLTVENTIGVGTIRHRLALGVQWLDAVSEFTLGEGWASELEAIGKRPCPLRFNLNPRGRHALRAAGRLARLLAVAAEEKESMPPPPPEDDPTNFLLRAFGRRVAGAEAYTTGNDPRRYVPRRLALTPVQDDGIPTDTAGNIRTTWAWPGASYPLASKATALRGWVRRGPDEANAVPVPWARVAVTRPGGGPPDFANEVKLGFAHGDDRGEFLAVLGPNAVPGGAELPPTIAVRIWVFLPPFDLFDPADPLAGLPLEVAGTAAESDVLRGIAMPPAYVQQAPFVEAAVPTGAIFPISNAKLLFS
jgi:hypothetical protein